MKDRESKIQRRWAIAALLLLMTVACDQATKHVAASSFIDEIPYSLIGGFVELFYSENPGAFLGLGSDFHHSTRFWLFTVGVGGLLLVFSARLFQATKPVELVGWSLVIGGGASNLIDRLVRDGRVVDFLRIGIGEIRTGIFNVADAAIVLGLLCLFASAVWLHSDRPRIAYNSQDGREGQMSRMGRVGRAGRVGKSQ